MVNQIIFFLNSANLICRTADISKYFRESLGIRDNESRLYIHMIITNTSHVGLIVETLQTLLFVLDCESNYYGDMCTACGNCLDDDICDATTGICPNGCAAGWTGNLCTEGYITEWTFPKLMSRLI